LAVPLASARLESPSNKKIRRSKTSKVKPSEHPLKRSKRLDKATIASKLQLQEQQREFIYSLIALFMKIGLLAIFTGSFVKLGLASHQRIMRQIELASILKIENEKLDRLNFRFDRLFTIGGQDRLINEQDHLIAPNRKRIIWK
tara:strand:- start:3861 stop:4292 length:432 start_codon:yes stop_codon:yes gene_type:complete